ncbi:MAG: SUMF1/EgtB/PvdO family nonheme iron enzyme [Armatimonadota bacterium]|nr:SUMF1/EgtB/PvdO family nonheme iron enzyme [Armatimonadota bacterium]
MTETGHQPKGDTERWRKDDRVPGVHRSWDDGAASARWAGARLPTEVERERAARGADGRGFVWREWTSSIAKGYPCRADHGRNNPKP